MALKTYRASENGDGKEIVIFLPSGNAKVRAFESNKRAAVITADVEMLAGGGFQIYSLGYLARLVDETNLNILTEEKRI